MHFEFNLSTRIRFGAGVLERLDGEIKSLGGRRTLIVCDPGIVRAGLAARVERILGRAGQPFAVFSAVSANPRDSECLAGTARARSFGADMLIGLGGGSAMDAAKAIGLLAANGGTPRDWADGRRPALQSPPPLICIPTTAGTGSEVTPVAVITDSAANVKMALLGTTVAPAVALVDPELTYGLPADITAATGMDALTHAIEAYTCRMANPVSDALALAAIEKIGVSLPIVCRNGRDAAARGQMLLASLLAGVAFGQADVGAVHSMAETLGGLCDTPHGVANAVFLPHVMAYNLESDLCRHARLGRLLCKAEAAEADGAAAWLGVRAVTRLAEEVGIPPLSEVVTLAGRDIDRLAERAAAHPCTPSNARTIGRNGYRDLFRRAYAGALPRLP